MSQYEAQNLRWRARRLRDLAVKIDQLSVFGLMAAAGDDTWVGPRPLDCRNRLHSANQGLHEARQQVLWSATRLDHRALHLELLALAAPGPR